ncbi:MAG: Fe-S cluster assembly protein IscX [Magnetococcus sp. THC-1_WYH]
MKWTDVREIGIALADSKPDIDPLAIRFTDLMQWVMALPGFDDEVKRCNEKILETIQQVWLEERD